MKTNLFIRISMTLALFCATISSASAQYVSETLPNERVAGDVVLSPAKIELQIAPGGSATTEILVANRSSETRDFTVSAEDFMGSKDPETPVVFGTQSPYALAAGISVPAATFTLPAGALMRIPVTVRIPESFGPGGRYAGVFVSSSAAQSETGAAVESRIGALLFVTVPGAITEDASLVSFELLNKERLVDGGPVSLIALFENRGNAHLNPYGGIVITDTFGFTVERIELEPWFALPDSIRSREIVWEQDGGIPVGRYVATIELNRGYGDVIDTKSVTFWVLPGTAVMVASLLLLAMLAMIVGRIALRTRRIPQLAAIALVLLVPFAIAHVDAQTMQSNNYQIERDSLNTGGGAASSASYESEDTTGEVATGYSESGNYMLHAGYQQMDGVFLSLSAAANVSLFPSIDNAVGGTANGSTEVLTTTNNPTGYELSIEGEATPAFRSGASTIADYVPAGANPDFAFTVGTGDSSFGYSPEGVDVADRFRDNGAACNAGAGDTSLSCWDGLSTTGEVIAESGTDNFPGGSTTTVRFRLGVDATATPDAGTYVATSTITVIAI